MKSRLWRYGGKLFVIKDTPQSIALGAAIGVFLGFTPLFGLKTLLALLLAALFRVNKIAAVVAVSLHDLLILARGASPRIRHRLLAAAPAASTAAALRPPPCGLPAVVSLETLCRRRWSDAAWLAPDRHADKHIGLFLDTNSGGAATGEESSKRDFVKPDLTDSLNAPGRVAARTAPPIWDWA